MNESRQEAAAGGRSDGTGAEIRTATVRERPDSGLTAEELKDPWKAMFSGGVAKMFEARKALTAQELGDAGTGGDEDVFRFVAECEKFGDAEAEKRREERKERRMNAEAILCVPLWQQVSGLYPDDEPKMSPRERLGAMLLLVKNAERLLRYEIKYSGEQKSEIDAAEVRTYLWDPLRTVCFHLGISQRRLTAYCKELTGMSAMEMVDRMKAEGVRGKLKEELRRFIKLTAEDAEDAEERNGDKADQIFAELKASRRDGRWHRTTWAMGLGFSSYQRFFRACLLCYGKTPHELELEIIEDILTEPVREGVTAAAASVVREGTSVSQPEPKRNEGAIT
ncbi:MAG TPA: hypothetical protein VGP72_10695 [Planctomycetota bacterium]|jgi:AraC-like DNA-binding protein